MTEHEKNQTDEASAADDRSSTAKALDVVSRIISGCLSLVIPIILGAWGDQRWGTSPLFTLAGLAFGFMAGGWQLWRFAKASE